MGGYKVDDGVKDDPSTKKEDTYYEGGEKDEQNGTNGQKAQNSQPNPAQGQPVQANNQQLPVA